MYSSLPHEGPDATALGSAFITLVEPHPGHEHAYNRWYEDDHFYAGAMAFPWWFAGRRWVATRALRDLRFPADSSVAQPVDAGCYLGTYWITDGRHRDQWQWLGATVKRLSSEGRMFAERTHVHTMYYDVAGSVRGNGPRDFQALDHPYAGLVIEVLEADDRPALMRWLEAERAPSVGAGLCVWFTPHPRPPDDELWFDTPHADPRRLLVLWFLEHDPREGWSVFAHDAAAAAGVGRAEFVAPFIPTRIGTDDYVDELR